MRHLLKEMIINKDVRVCVLGLGYVGLPLAVELAKIGYLTIGIDKNIDRVEQVKQGYHYVSGKNDEELKQLVQQGKLNVFSSLPTGMDMDVIVICVPTSLTKNLTPDLQHVRSASEEISKIIKPGQLICLESTVYPGTTEDVVLPVLESTGLQVEKDFFLCHSPERVDPGNKTYTTENTNKIVGGIGPHSLDLGLCFYEQTISHVVPVTDVKAAELAKIYENTFRAVNIALANEFALLCDKMKICVWDVLEAAFTKPFGIMPFYPGPGVGGHCIPIDPHYIEWKAREYNFLTRFINIAGEINRKMPEHVREIIIRTLNNNGLAPSCSKILILGMSYKKDVNDSRESPAVCLAELLLKDGIELMYHDPFVSEVTLSTKKIYSVPLCGRVVNDVDIVLIITDHSTIDYHWLVNNARTIVDTRNATKGIPGREKKVVLI
ncbi:nucleotide sugar dehydrogenase [Candidatus Contubernalis alkaliaceticus]|uniref:nucleotide sugar dehydrogenase n=1 Tax=Candidatus Contubernalis alkaliaceticus TaxID=338645 RepID=UPI001F4C467D|nr:nucleotide sugar dehydrogenase [Candidatus Contubernalis alkalaceticus]UNC92308.1 nucleotide sugar dehydrogenase [Candidatus Contubernalis alkalaceticus]